MLQIAQNVDLFHELFSAFVTSAGFHVVFYSNWALHESATRDFAITALSDGLNDLYIFLFDNKI